MCILCVVQRWSRRVATMLPWLVIPLIALWAFSQLLPPRFRFEVTSPRLACVTVLLVTLFWYEILMPQLSVWRARRSARLRERRRAQALELQKLRKAATRRCRNCLTAYRDQKPGCGRFMCSYCGHISKRPVLDLPGGSCPSPGINGWICGQDWAAEGNGGWVGPVPRYWVGNDRCMTEKSYSGALLFACKLLSCFFGSIWWILKKIFRLGSSSKDSPDGDNKGSLRRGENDGNCQESRGEKARRKAEEKRQARLEKEMLEEEERKQREEVARLVEERRKLRDEILEAERIHSRGSGLDGDRDRRKEAEKRRQERKKEKDKGSSKSNSDVEEFDKRTSRENEKKRELDKKSETDRRDAQKFVADKHKFHTSESGNGLKVATSKSKYFDRVTGSSLSPSKGFNGASFFGRNAQGTSATVTKVNKPTIGSVDQTFGSAIRKDAYPAIHAMGKITSAVDDRISKCNFDRAVGSEVKPPTPAPKKSWHQLFTRSAASPHDGVNTNGFSNQNEKAEAYTVCMTGQRVAASYSLDNQISVQPSPFSISPSVNGSRGGNLVSHLLPAESIPSERVQNSILEEAEIFEDPCYNPDPLSLLGPVSDSLDNFPLDLGAGFVSCNKTEEPHHASKKITAPADVSKPSPIESPISRLRISEEKRTAIGQPPSTPKSPDGASNTLEQRTWQMWGTPLAQDALDMVTGPSSWFSPLGQKKSNLEDMMHPLSHNPMLSHVAVENHSLPGTHSPQIAHVDNSLNGGMFSPFGHGLNENDIWMHKTLFPQLPGDGESHVTHFPQFNLMDNAARNEMRLDVSNGSEALHPFDLPPANCWSKKEWALHGLQDAGNSNPAPNPGSLFSTGPDVQSVWASNQMDRI